MHAMLGNRALQPNNFIPPLGAHQPRQRFAKGLHRSVASRSFIHSPQQLHTSSSFVTYTTYRCCLGGAAHSQGRRAIFRRETLIKVQRRLYRAEHLPHLGPRTSSRSANPVPGTYSIALSILFTATFRFFSAVSGIGLPV